MPTVSTKVIELSGSEDETEFSPTPNRRPHKLIRPRPSVPEVIDLCSDDEPIRTAKSSPIRVQIETNVTVISSDDESQPSTSETTPRRPTRLKKRTFKAQALLDRKHAAKASRGDVSETQVPLAPSSLAEENVQSVRHKRKRFRPSRAASPTNAVVPERIPDHAETELNDTESTRGHRDGDKQARVPHNRNISPVQENSQSFPTLSRPDTVPPPGYRSTPTPSVPHTPTGPPNSNLPLSELSTHIESPGTPITAKASKHGPQSVLDTIPDTEPALQDTKLLPLASKEGGMENDVENPIAHLEEQPVCADGNNPAVPSGEPQDEPMGSAPDQEDHVESTGAHTPVQPSAHLFVSNMQDVLSQEGGGTSEIDLPDSTIHSKGRTPLFLPDNASNENEDMELQDALMASSTQLETEMVSGDIFNPRVVPMDVHVLSSGSGLVQPVPYSEIVDHDDTSPYMPPHLSHAPAVEVSKFGPSKLNADLVLGPEQSSTSTSTERQLGYEDENEDVQIQKALLQPLPLNREPSGEIDADRNRDEHDTNERNGGECTDPIPTPLDPTSMPPDRDDSAEDVASESSTASSKPSSPQLSTRHITPDNSSGYLNGPLGAPDMPTALSHAVSKPAPSITYSYRAFTTLPDLLTPRFFTQSFLLPDYRNTLNTEPPVVGGPAPQSEPEPFQPPQHSSSVSPVVSYVSPTSRDYDGDDPRMTDSSRAVQMNVETYLQPDTRVTVQSSVACEKSPSEEAEEAEVDLELTNAESLENVRILAAAVKETNMVIEIEDVQGHATDSPAGNRSASPESGPLNPERPRAENGSWPASGLDSSSTRRSNVDSAKRDRDGTPERQYPNSEEPNLLGKSQSEASLGSSATIEDSPVLATPPASFDPSSFFIRSSSPMNFDHDILKNYRDISVPPLLEDDDSYLLSTHSFDYPDDIDVVG